MDQDVGLDDEIGIVEIPLKSAVEKQGPRSEDVMAVKVTSFCEVAFGRKSGSNLLPMIDP